jgi:hypothetical protein
VKPGKTGHLDKMEHEAKQQRRQQAAPARFPNWKLAETYPVGSGIGNRLWGSRRMV